MYHDYALGDVLAIKEVSTRKKSLLPVKCNTKQKLEDKWGFIKLEVNPTICPGLVGNWSHQLPFLKF